ncbi:hypothetical protein N4T57_03850 [Campylobacter hepaticus]|uniref:Uncharacterized protein n=1 Tax=Campylobacter hepaticus TaxID=1813019 RepID=A0A424Z226_9BACT|nr:hypothetical protein [Campylobacter hepaticus]AXP08454.1 hypothetical protein A2J15_001695 [Campylobacter hepaticus]MCZ0772286.1 hypothetical protein [Campylobacter hepaticus]MCZ0773754.1 hypothetical protein [Campylobacter hepaticus]MCZ0775005.1 hypothetical protein [Campylobacter hepaticus]MDX2322874.1 hypothetical protein [Campylobacter hepaticus]
MSRILIYIFIILFLSFLIFILDKKLGKKVKPFFGILFVICIILIVFFEFKNTQKSHLKNDIIVAFNQGKSILCKDINISKMYFNYEFGTGSFISKDNNQSFNSLIIDIKDCRFD